MTELFRSPLRHASRFFSATLISRFSGLFRDIATAFFFGTSPLVALFMMAFRFSNLMRRLLAESPVAASFTPELALRQKRSLKEGFIFYQECSWSLFLLSSIVVLLLESLLYALSFFLSVESEWHNLIVLTMQMLPSLVFLSLAGLNSALLQAEGRFFLPGLAPTVFNVVWVIGAAFASLREGVGAMKVLSIGVVIGFFSQWLVTFLGVYKRVFSKRSLKEWLLPRILKENRRGILRAFAFGIMGVGASQINTTLDLFFAKLASSEGPAYLWYASRFYQLPIGLIGVSLASALLPHLSREKERGEKGIFQGVYLGVIAMFSLISVAFPLINFFYGRGAFSVPATLETVKALLGYSLGIVPGIATLLLASSFYAKKEYKKPLRSSLISLLSNTILSLVFVLRFHMGVIGIALATSISQWIQCGYLTYYSGLIFSHERLCSFLKVTLVGIIAVIASWSMGHLLWPNTSWTLFLFGGRGALPREFSLQLFHLLLEGIAFIALFLSLLWIVERKTVREFFDEWRGWHLKTPETADL